MTILGIDPGSGTIGFGVINRRQGRVELIGGGVIQTTIGMPASYRLVELATELKQLIKEFTPDVAVVEQLFFARNVTTAMAVSQARGVILLCLAEAGIPITELTPLQIKMSTVGYGRASKAQIKEMVRLQLHLAAPPTPDDCADALAAALAYLPDHSRR